MSKVFGFVAEPHKDGYYFVSAATKEEGLVTCHDLSGFLGNWEMREGGIFFPTITGDSFCNEALQNANDYAKEKNYD